MHYNLKYCVLLSFLILLSVLHASPTPTENKKDRVINSKPLSEESHFGDNAAHNVEYDHEAFLGKEEAREFDQLTPEQSKERLSQIVDKIDTDKNGFVTEEELVAWIQYAQKKYIMDDVERQWASHNVNNEEALSWATYKKVVYSFIDENADAEDDDVKNYQEMMSRDKRRWEAADKNRDDTLTKEEFTDFLHPEEASHMKDVVVIETLEDIDKDGDGRISLEEYISDMYSGSEDEQPDWVKSERETFALYRDKDKDGFMDKEEVKEWIIPSDYNQSEAEAKHLIHESDENKDQQLSKEEILSNYDLFVGSQATDFGEALTRHDEF